MKDKKLYEGLLKQVEAQKEAAETAIEQDNVLIEFFKKKIDEFPDDKKADPMPDELKDILPKNV